jgi:hypothetical protein
MSEEIELTPEIIAQVRKHLEAQDKEGLGVLTKGEIDSIHDYIKSTSTLVTTLARIMSTRKVETVIEQQFKSHALREKEVIKIMKDWLYGNTETK